MSMRSDLAPERPIDRQRAAAADEDREADQQEIKRDLHATAGPEPADLEVDMKGGDRHEAAKQWATGRVSNPIATKIPPKNSRLPM
jgi:hypothetical protein